MRRGPGHFRAQTIDSNGPDVKLRGTANQILEKYLALARDATAHGDRITAENYLQHAEHYYRLVNSNGPAQRSYPPSPAGGHDGAGEINPRDNADDA